MVHNYGVPLKLETRYATASLSCNNYQHSTQEPLVESGSSLKGFSCCAAQQLKTFAHSWSFEILSFEADFWRPLKADLEETGRRSLAFTVPSSSTSLFWTTRLWPCVLKPLFLDLGLLFSISHLCQHLHFPSHQNQSCSWAQIRCRGCKVAIFTKAAGTDMAHMVHMVHIWHISTYGTKVHMAHTVHIVHIEHMAHIWHKEQLSLITTMITPHEWR